MLSTDVTKRDVGVNINEDGSATVVVWAPQAESIELKLEKSGQRIPLVKGVYGYWREVTQDIYDGDLYKFVIDGKLELPDPASLSQPGGVHGPSSVFNLKRFNWSDTDWKNIALN